MTKNKDETKIILKKIITEDVGDIIYVAWKFTKVIPIVAIIMFPLILMAITTESIWLFAYLVLIPLLWLISIWMRCRNANQHKRGPDNDKT